MKFYTNVQLIGNQFLVRGVENGRRYEHRDEFFPTLFVKSKKDSKYRTLSGETVEEMEKRSALASKARELELRSCFIDRKRQTAIARIVTFLNRKFT